MAANPTPMPIPIPNFNIPLVYANGFNAGLSNSEVTAFLMHDNQPMIKLALPLPTAKALAAALNELVGKYEQATQTKVLSVEELSEMLSKLNAE